MQLSQFSNARDPDLTHTRPSQISYIGQIPHLQAMSIDMPFRAGRHRVFIERFDTTVCWNKSVTPHSCILRWRARKLSENGRERPNFWV